MPILRQDDGSAYPFDLSGLPVADQEKAVAIYQSQLKGGAEYSAAQSAAERYCEDCRNPPAAKSDHEPANGPAKEPDEEEPATNLRKPMNARALILALSAAAAVGLAALAYDRFFPASPANVDPLAEIAQVRAQAALELKAANETLKTAKRVQEKAQSRYDAAWKREACLIAGNCQTSKK